MTIRHSVTSALAVVALVALMSAGPGADLVGLRGMGPGSALACVGCIGAAFITYFSGGWFGLLAFTLRGGSLGVAAACISACIAAVRL